MSKEKVALAVDARLVSLEFEVSHKGDCDGDVASSSIPYYHSKGVKRMNYKYRKLRIYNPKIWWC